MLQRLSNAAIHTAADKKKMARRGMLQQCIEDCLFSGALVGRISPDYA
jgi:hypothetical protein